jgi:hypothetical protein
MKLGQNGVIYFDTKYEPVIKPSVQLFQFCKKSVAMLIGIVVLIIGLPLVLFWNRMYPVKQKRVMVGTHPIVSNIHYKQLLQKSLHDYEIEIFIFSDWLGEKSYFDKNVDDILPKWLVGKDAYLFSPFFILLWALRRYRGFYWHMDGAILERTFLWRLEPLILEIFGKKLVMQAYGADQWSMLQSSENLNFKFGLANFRKRYFMMDFKRIERNYMWAQYADVISGDFRYLPRLSAVSMAHFYIVLDELPYYFNPNTEKIIITHFSNHPERKGSYAIEAICEELIQEGYPIEYRSVHGVSRQEALEILDESHIFIEHLFNGVFGTAALEAMAKGNVVLSHLDQRLIDLCLIQHYKFYAPFFKEMPIVNTDIHRLKDQIIKLVENPVELQSRIEASRDFVEESARKVVEGFVSDDEHGLKALYESGK